MEKLVIVGTGAMARDVKAFVNRYQLYEIIGYACNQEYLEDAKKAMPDDAVCAIGDLDQFYKKEEVKLFVAISHFQMLNRVRKDTFEQLKHEGWQFATLIAPTATIYAEDIGEGCWIMDGVYLGNESVIECNTVISNYVYVSHYCHVGAHNYLGGHSLLMGSVKTGYQCFIGSRATIFNNVTVGNRCLIGGATTIKRSMNDNTVAKLPNDLVILKEYPDDVIETKLMPPQMFKK